MKANLFSKELKMKGFMTVLTAALVIALASMAYAGPPHHGGGGDHHGGYHGGGYHHDSFGFGLYLAPPAYVAPPPAVVVPPPAYYYPYGYYDYPNRYYYNYGSSGFSLGIRVR